MTMRIRHLFIIFRGFLGKFSHFPPKVGLWSSKLCDTYGEDELRVVRLGGRGAVAMPRTQHLRTPKCRGLGRWDLRWVDQENK